LAGADASHVARRAAAAPTWLTERIERCYAARRLIGEDVTPEQNARDQLVAFTVHVLRRRRDLDGPWAGARIPDQALDQHLALEELLAQIG
jgi:hypothetical protein